MTVAVLGCLVILRLPGPEARTQETFDMALAQRAARGAICTRNAVNGTMRVVVMPVSCRAARRQPVQNARLPSRGVLRGAKQNWL